MTTLILAEHDNSSLNEATAKALTALIFWGSPRFRDANAPLLVAYAALAFAPVSSSPRPSGERGRG